MGVRGLELGVLVPMRDTYKNWFFSMFKSNPRITIRGPNATHFPAMVTCRQTLGKEVGGVCLACLVCRLGMLSVLNVCLLYVLMCLVCVLSACVCSECA